MTDLPERIYQKIAALRDSAVVDSAIETATKYAELSNGRLTVEQIAEKVIRECPLFTPERKDQLVEQAIRQIASNRKVH